MHKLKVTSGGLGFGPFCKNFLKFDSITLRGYAFFIKMGLRLNSMSCRSISCVELEFCVWCSNVKKFDIRYFFDIVAFL